MLNYIVREPRPVEELPLCSCGCGKRVTYKTNRYIIGHNWTGKKHKEESKLKMKRKQVVVEESKQKKYVYLFIFEQ